MGVEANTHLSSVERMPVQVVLEREPILNVACGGIKTRSGSSLHQFKHLHEQSQSTWLLPRD